MNFRLSCRRALLALILTAVLCLQGCQRETPEDAVRSRLAEIQAAAVERNPRDFIDGVAEDFIGNDGMDRAALHNLLRAQLLANRDVRAATGPVEVEVNGSHATVKFTVVLTGGDGTLLPDSAQAYAVTSGWRDENGEWRVYYAQWERAL